MNYCRKDFHPERDNICAYVCFTEEDSARKALKMWVLQTFCHAYLYNLSKIESTQEGRNHIFTFQVKCPSEKVNWYKDTTGIFLELNVIWHMQRNHVLYIPSYFFCLLNLNVVLIFFSQEWTAGQKSSHQSGPVKSQP